jgi:cyclophilin family peptidyl-prolyl cis-trans isomerase
MILTIGVLVTLAAYSLPLRAQGAAQALVPSPAPAPGPVLVFETVKGTFEIETYPTVAPKTVAHVVDLVRKGFYDGLRIHRRDENFIVQFGDPQTRDMASKPEWGRSDNGTPIGVSEISKALKQSPGMVSIGHRGDAAKGDSHIFIVVGPASHIDGKYAIFGKVAIGLDVVRRLEVDDRILRATVRAEGD